MQDLQKMPRTALEGMILITKIWISLVQWVSMQNVGSKKVCQKYGKLCQKGVKMGAEIYEKNEKKAKQL